MNKIELRYFLQKSGLTSFILLIGLSLSAQEARFTAGALLGFNGIQIANDIEDRVGAGGLSAGLCLALDIATRASLQLELKYTQKGSIHPYVNPYGIQDWEVLRLNYMELPLVFRYGFGKKPSFFFMEGGFAWAYLFKRTYSETHMQKYSPPDFIDQYRQNELSWILGAGYKVNQGALRNFAFLFRFNRSILPIHESVNYYNVVYGVYLYYYLNFRS